MHAMQQGPLLARLPEYHLSIISEEQLTACAGVHFLCVWKGQEHNACLRTLT